MGSGSHICLGNMFEQPSQSRWDVSVVIDCACSFDESKGGKRNGRISAKLCFGGDVSKE